MTDQKVLQPDAGMQESCSVCLGFGRKILRGDELRNLQVEAVAELDAFVDDYVDVYADGRLIARGLPVVVDGKLGVRVQESMAATVAS